MSFSNMRRFENYPIRTKITVFIMVVAFLAVVSLSSAFVLQRYHGVQDQLSDEFGTVTNMVANRVQAAFFFNSMDVIDESLNGLSLHPDILLACAYSLKGDVLSSFRSNSSQACPIAPPSESVLIDSRGINTTANVMYEGQFLGKIFLRSSTHKIQVELERAVLNASLSSLVLIVIALLFARYIERFISDPLVELRNAAEAMSLHQTEFRVLIKKNDDEVGTLVDAFNQMRSTISAQHGVIQASKTELEFKVMDRTVELARANEDLKAFSYMLSHDLNSLIRVVKGFTDALVQRYMHVLDEDGRYFLQRIAKGSAKMDSLSKSLTSLTFANRHTIQFDAVMLNELAYSTIEDLQARDPDRKVFVDIQPDMIACCDESLIHIVIDNLIGNAWKYTSQEQTAVIRFGLQEIEGESVFFVQDNGVGFSMYYADLVVQPFKRLHQEEHFDGSGIGMSTVKRVIERHYGRLWFESEEGIGSVFYFTLFSELTS